MWDGVEQFVVEPVGPNLEPFRMARRAQDPNFAAERDEKLGTAPLAPDPREPRLQNASIEKLLDRAPRLSPQPAAARLELVLVSIDEQFELALDQSVERGLLRSARLVGAWRRSLHAPAAASRSVPEAESSTEPAARRIFASAAHALAPRPSGPGDRRSRLVFQQRLVEGLTAGARRSDSGRGAGNRA